MKDFFGDEIKKTVFISNEQLHEAKIGKVYGKYYPDTEIINVFPPEISDQGDYIGDIFQENDNSHTGFYGIKSNQGLDFFYDGEKLNVESYDLYQNIFSRNTGILETSIMEKKRVVILGCGSVGSQVAMEMARAGVGHFVLADQDTLEYHNVCRHQCGIDDVGDLKVNALARKLMKINPKIEIQKFGGVIQNIPKAILDDFCVAGDTIFVGCADNRVADVYANRISIYYDAAFLSIGFWERAFAGEIFYHIPHKNMPCYECALGEGGDLSSRSVGNHHLYSSQENLNDIKFEPGISVDINFITSVGNKLIIDILNANNPDYKPRLLNHLEQYTLVCNTCDQEIGGDLVSIFSYPLQVSTSLKVDFRKSCNKQCKYELLEK